MPAITRAVSRDETVVVRLRRAGCVEWRRACASAGRVALARGERHEWQCDRRVARIAAFPRDAAAIATTAVELFAGTPYQWGGVSPWGADCSGLMQTAFWLHGVALPRDAWQQAAIGEDAGSDVTRWSPAT